MADVQLSPFVLRGQRDDQRAEHRIEFLRVAVCLEVSARPVKQQLVGLGRDAPRDSEIFADALQGRIQMVLPRRRLEGEIVRVELPAFADGFVILGFRSLAIGSGFRQLDERGGLFLGKRKRNFPHSLQGQSRKEKR